MSRAKATVSVVEAAYALDGSEREWLERITRAAAPLLDRGLGVISYGYDMKTHPLGVSTIVYLDVSRRLRQAFLRIVATANRAEIAASYGRGVSCITMRQSVDDFPDWLEEMFRRAGIHDVLAVNAAQPDGSGVIVTSAAATPWPNNRDHAWRWSRVAAHIAAGARLRRALVARSSRITIAGEAILDPTGKVHDANGPAKSKSAREALHRAVRDMQRARGPLRRSDPDEALQIWRALVAGRWSLVDTFDSDGKRFVVARRNDPKLRDPRRLSQRERQVVAYAALGHANKLIAYELGLGPATVSAHLRSAMSKLGVKTRAELVRRMR